MVSSNLVLKQLGGHQASMWKEKNNLVATMWSLVVQHWNDLVATKFPCEKKQKDNLVATKWS